MILIFSEEKDISAKKVCEWLSFYNVNFLNVTEKKSFNIIERIKIDNNKSEILFRINGIDININDISKIWFRRNEIRYSMPNLDFINYDLRFSLSL